MVQSLCPTLCNPVTVAWQAPLSMGFFRQEYAVGCHFFIQGGLPDPEIKPMASVWQVDTFPLSHQENLQ